MCFGSSKKQHHQSEERKRANALQNEIFDRAERDRQAEIARMTAMQQEADKRQQEALRAIAESSKQPFQVRTMADAGTPIMRTKQKAAESRRGIADLRIARTLGTNTGAGTSGTNIG